MRKLLNICISYIFPAAVVGYVLLTVSPQKIVHTLSQVVPQWVFIGFSLYSVNYIFRSLRFKTLIHSKKVCFKEIFKVSCFHSMYNYFLPARVGEFSYVFYLKRITNIPTLEGLSTLFVARALDLITVFIFLPITFIFLREDISNEHVQLIIIFAVVVLFMSILFFTFVFGGQKVIHACDMCLSKIKLDHRSIWKSIRRKMEQFHDSFVVIHKRRVYHKIITLTLLIWCSVYGYFFMIVKALGVQISLWQIILILMIMVPARLLPIQGFGNVGTHEIGWVLALRIFGFSQNEALLIAFNSHILIVLYVLILGGYAILSTRKELQEVNDSLSP